MHGRDYLIHADGLGEQRLELGQSGLNEMRFAMPGDDKCASSLRMNK